MIVPPLETYFLGPFRVVLNGQPVTGFAADKVRALLAYLAVESGHPHRREALAWLLWPDYPDTDALANLRKALFRLRQALGEDAKAESPDFLMVTPQTVQLNTGTYRLDIDEFTRLIEASNQHRHRKMERCATCHARLRRAAELYRGDFLAGFIVDGSEPFDEWLLLNRERLRRYALDVFGLLAGYHETRGEYTEALPYAHKQIELEPWREEAHRQVMNLLWLDGQRGAALAQYEACRRVLLQELGVEPEAETVALYERIRSGGRGSGVGNRESVVPGSRLPAPDSQPLLHSLPQQMSRFVGREGELAAITERLDSAECRLVTLVGPGGVGKSRLAIQAASGQVGAFDDGVWFVPLAAANTSALLVTTIARTVGLRLQSATKQPETELLDYLRDKEMLLVLDNFEQLLDSGIELLISILNEAPRITILVTSRESLGLQTEYIFGIEGLPLPDVARIDTADTGLVQYLGSSAMQLFVERARQAQWDFALSTGNAQGVLDICRLVEGLPLGIVLAAAWVRQFPTASIASSIRKNLDFLTSTMRDAPPHHRSLRAVFNHSWNLLSDEERRVFRRLSVFRGGWEASAAESVADTTPQVLVSLADKSLLRTDESGRFDIHEVLRQYAGEQLGEEPEEQSETLARHAHYFLQLAEDAEGELTGPEQDTWLKRLDLEHDNLRAALRWASEGEGKQQVEGETDRVEAGLRTGGAIWRFWEARGYRSEGREWLGRLLALQRSVPQDQIAVQAQPRLRVYRAKALHGAGALAYTQWDLSTARSLHEESLALRREIGDKKGIALSLGILGSVTFMEGGFSSARSLYEESLALYREIGDKWGIALTVGNLGLVALEQGDYTTARSLYEESLALRREIGDKSGIAYSLHNLGQAALEQGDYSAARSLYEQSLALYREIGNKWSIAVSLRDLGRVALEQGDYTTARSLCEEGLALSIEIGDKLGRATTLNYFGLAAYEQGDYSAARSLYEEGLALSREIGTKKVIAISLAGLAGVAVAQAGADRDVVERGARLLGAVEALLENMGVVFYKVDRLAYERFVASARSQLGEERFAAAWAEGRAMPEEQAVGYALEEVI